MPLFSKPDPNEVRLQERHQKSREQIERGGLPLDAEWRLNKLASPDGKGFFSSNLSVNEFVLARAQGVRALGQVMGSSVYHVGWQFQPLYSSTELVALTHAQTQARTLALGRLQQEAAILGAHGVVGVRLTRRSYEWGSNLLEFTAQGTAIELENAPKPSAPFLSPLSGQDYFALRQAGHHPVGFAFGTCVYYHVASYSTQWMTQGGLLGGGWAGNTELTDYTQAVYTARHLAMHRLTEDAARSVPPGANGAGIVGVTIENEIETYEVKVNDQERRDLVVQFTAIGTVVAPFDTAAQPAVHLVTPLNT